MRRARTRYGVAPLATLLLVVIGCDPAASGPGTVTPGGDGNGVGADPAGPHTEASSAQELDAELSNFVAKQETLKADAMSDTKTCESVCSLTADICGVTEKLCKIADEHPQDAEYGRLCREARNDCRDAEEACVNCVRGEDGGLSTQPDSARSQ